MDTKEKLESEDLEGVPEMTSPVTVSPRDELLEAFAPQRDFCRIFQDAFALVDRDGRVLKYNQMFCLLSGAKAFELRKEPLVTEFLNGPEGTGDFARLLAANQPMRFDELSLTRLRTAQVLQLIASSYPFLAPDGRLLGACLLLRDVTAEASLQGKYTERTMESLTDPLTGLFSRRFLERIMNGESLDIAGTGVGNSSVSVLMCDIDHFKRINDSFGHLGGDAVLKAVAHELRKACRSTDRVARYGGEEFAIILPETGYEGACVVAEKIRRAVAAASVPFENAVINVTISIGGTERFNRTESMKSVIARADECLYKAKSSGRNRCVLAKETELLVASSDHEWQVFQERQAG